MRLPPLLALVAVPLLASPLRAGVIVVDPAGGGDFTSLSPAIAAAAEGDTVLISPSAPCVGCDIGHGSIEGKSLTVVFDVSRASPAAFAVEYLEVLGLGPGQTVVLRGLHVDGSILLHNNDGAVWVEDCVATGFPGNGSGGLFPCFQPPDYGAGVGGITTQNCADVTVVDCSLQGGVGDDAFFNPSFPTLSVLATDGGHALRAQNASVAVFGSTLTGGVGGAGQICGESADGGAGVMAALGARVLLSGCTLQGGEPGVAPPVGAPGPGVLGDATSTFEIVDSSVTAWPGGVDFATAPGSVVDYPGVARRFALPAPLREGEAGTLSIAGEMGDVVGFFWSFNGLVTPKPAKSGWFLLGGPLIAGPFLLGAITDPSGEWLVPITAPTLPAALEEQTFLLQAYFQHPGGATLGSGTAFTLLDASL